MNILDGIILIPLLIAGFQGFKNGLVREVLGLAGVLVALFLAFRYMEPFSEYIGRMAETPDAVWIPFAAFALIFLVVIALVQATIIFLDKVLAMIFLSVPNRIFGLFFGFLKSSLFISLILLLLAGINFPDEDTRNKSALYPYMMTIAPSAYNLMGKIYPGTEEFSESIQRTLDRYSLPGIQPTEDEE